jgi:hypothetical protein
VILSMGDSLVPAVMNMFEEMTGGHPAPTNSQTLLCDRRCLVGALITYNWYSLTRSLQTVGKKYSKAYLDLRKLMRCPQAEDRGYARTMAKACTIWFILKLFSLRWCVYSLIYYLQVVTTAKVWPTYRCVHCVCI